MRVERGLDPVAPVEVVIDAAGGAFQIGGSYLLFLKERQPGGSYYRINDQARFVLQGDRVLSFARTDHDPAIETLHRQRLASAPEMVERLVNRVRK